MDRESHEELRAQARDDGDLRLGNLGQRWQGAALGICLGGGACRPHWQIGCQQPSPGPDGCGGREHVAATWTTPLCPITSEGQAAPWGGDLEAKRPRPKSQGCRCPGPGLSPQPTCSEWGTMKRWGGKRGTLGLGVGPPLLPITLCALLLCFAPVL